MAKLDENGFLVSKKDKDAYWLRCMIQHDIDHHKYDVEHKIQDYSILDM